MAAGRPRSMLASIVGWVIVALVLFWLLGAVIGTIRFLIRFLVWAIVLVALVALYLNLRAPADD
ncbi:MAG: hypothetical protein QNJ12_14210 [Ilumatobacter sp.]|uniref:hypothetical protein n=1 Tax=Ilumatobacter sp. TaxID=1967498 RepID=UPI002614A2B9|nr:hypothetical protein [Ilumatobacter sp.]MDJ0769950.1 hypothetical protein [Ilumatobacter sp.]